MKGKILALILCGCLAITGMTACSSNPDNNNSATDENAVDDDRKPTKTPSDGNEGSTVSQIRRTKTGKIYLPVFVHITVI